MRQKRARAKDRLGVAVLLVLTSACGTGNEPPARAPELRAGAVRLPEGPTVRYLATGQGPAGVVFVACWACNARFWEAQLELLGASTRAVALEPFWQGDPGVASVVSAGARLRSVLDGLGADRALLVGHGTGALVALEATVQADAGAVAGVVAVEAFWDARRLDGDARAILAAVRATEGTGAQPGAYARAAHDWAVAALAPATHPVLAEAVAGGVASAPAAGSLALLESAARYDTRAALDRTAALVVVLNGDRYPTDAATLRRLGVAEVAVLPGVGHFPMLEAPDDLAGRLQARLRRLGVR